MLKLGRTKKMKVEGRWGREVDDACVRKEAGEIIGICCWYTNENHMALCLTYNSESEQLGDTCVFVIPLQTL